jgi:hypothetical protein
LGQTGFVPDPFRRRRGYGDDGAPGVDRQTVRFPPYTAATLGDGPHRRGQAQPGSELGGHALGDELGAADETQFLRPTPDMHEPVECSAMAFITCGRDREKHEEK